MADNRFLSDRNLGEHAGLDFSQLDLRDSGQLTRIAGGVFLVMLGARGRSNLLRLAFTLAGATLLFRTFTNRITFSGKGRAESQRPRGRASRSVMRDDETLAQQRTRGGGVQDQE